MEDYNLFITLQNVCGFTALESDMDEIKRAIEKDAEISRNSNCENKCHYGISKPSSYAKCPDCGNNW